MQRVPRVTPDDVERIVRRDFPLELQEQVQSLLNCYPANPESRENPARVHLAILKLADGDPTLVAANVKVANQDFRDVIVQAEYPRGFKRMSRHHGRSDDRVDDQDWEQYRRWLEG